VQALSSGHSQADELGDGPMLVLTHGVPSIPAALLCQAGFASRTGAAWVTGRLHSAFTDADGLRGWIRNNQSSLSHEEFWKSDDHRLLWGHMSTPSHGDRPRKWNKRSVIVAPRWRAPLPTAGAFVRLVHQTGRRVLVCNAALEMLGSVVLPMDPRGAVLDADILKDGRLSVNYFGPK
jgi:hypothetical protein